MPLTAADLVSLDVEHDAERESVDAAAVASVASTLHAALSVALVGPAEDGRAVAPSEADLTVAEDALRLCLTLSFLLGRQHVQAEADADREAYGLPRPDAVAQAGDVPAADFADPGPVVTGRFSTSTESEPLTMGEAVDALRSRLPLDFDDFDALGSTLRLRTFTIARVAAFDALVAAQSTLADSLAAGSTPDEVRAAVQQALAGAGVDPLAPWHVDVVVRNNSAAAYAAGRWRQYDALGADLDALAFVGIQDRRQSSVCRTFNGLVAPVGADVWDYAYPPNHHACRSTTRAILRGAPGAGAYTSPADVAAMGRPSTNGAGLGWDAAARSIGDLSLFPATVLERAAAYGYADAVAELDRRAGTAVAKAQAAAPTAAAQAAKPGQTAAERARERLAVVDAEYAADLDPLQQNVADALARYNTENAKNKRSQATTDAARDYWRHRANVDNIHRAKRARAGEIIFEGAGKPARMLLGRVPASLKAKADEAADFVRRFVGQGENMRTCRVAVAKARAGQRTSAYYSAVQERAFLLPTSDVRTFVHEFAHHVETHDPTNGRLAQVQAFFDRRTAGLNPRRLNEIYPASTYKDWEVAVEDDFADAYAGKIYGPRGAQTATEIVSLGLEYLYTDAAAFARVDPDFFDFIFGLFRPDPAP